MYLSLPFKIIAEQEMVDININNSTIMPHEFQTAADISHQLEAGFRMICHEIRNVEVSIGQTVSDFLTSVVTPGIQPPTTSEVKQEKDGHLEVDSDYELNLRQREIVFQGKTKVSNGQKSEFKDPTDEEINEKLASFIQFLMTNRQPDDWFKTLSNETHRPANVAALRRVQLNSAVNGVLQTERNEAVDKLAYTQNCMLKGVTKTAYVMDTLFKHVDKLPKELQPKQLMSDLNAAMMFFGEANLEFIQIRKEMLMQKLKSSDKELFVAKIGSESHLFRPFKKNTDTASIAYKVELKTRSCGVGRGRSRHHPYHRGSNCNDDSSI